MSHQRVFPDWKWNISKFQFWRQILDIYRQPLLKKVNVMMEDVFICIGLRQDKKPNWLTWSEPELIIRLLFLLFYCLTVPLHVHVLFPFHFFAESRFRLFKSEKMWSDPIRLCPGGGDRVGGGGTPLYQLCRYVLPHRVGFLRRFGLKMSIHFANFALESGMVFEGSTGVHERIYRFNSKWVRKNEKYANSKWIWRIFCLRSNLSNDNVISA